jgi:hypothetical protein
LLLKLTSARILCDDGFDATVLDGTSSTSDVAVTSTTSTADGSTSDDVTGEHDCFDNNVDNVDIASFVEQKSSKRG